MRFFLTRAALFVVAGCTKEASYGEVLETPSPSVDTGLRVEAHPHAVEVEWSPLGLTPAGEFSMVSLSMHDPNRIFAGTDKSGLFMIREGASSFERVGAWDGPAPHVMAKTFEIPSQPESMIMVTTYDLWISHDVGQSFQLIDHFSMIPSGVMSLYALDDTIFIAEADGNIWLADDQFETVEHASQAPESPESKDWQTEDPAVSFKALNQEVWLLSQRRGKVYRTGNSGRSWDVVVSGAFDFDSLSVSDGSAMIATDDGLLLSTDLGLSWALIPDSPTNCINLSWRSPRVAAACNGTLHLSNDDGVTWNEKTLEEPPWSVDISSTNIEQIIVGSQDAVYLSADGGSSFQPVEEGLENQDIAHLAADPSNNDRVLLGTQCLRGFFQSNDQGATWSTISNEGHYAMAIHFAPSDPSIVYSCDTEFIFRSDDGGQSMTSYETLPEDVVHPHGMSVHPNEPMHVLVGTSDRAESGVPHIPQLLRSVDGGESWVRVGTGLPDGDIAFIDIAHDYSNPDRILVAAGPGGVFHEQATGTGEGLWISEDGAESFTQVGNLGTDTWVYNIQYNPLSTGLVLVTTSDGVFRSEDGGHTWEKTLNDNTQRQIAWHPIHKNVAFVSRELGSLISFDTGKTWATLGDNSDTHHTPPPPPDGNGAFMSGLSVSKDGNTLYISAGIGGGQRGELIWDMVHPEGTPEDY